LRAVQKELTRKLLLESGLRVFENKGYGAATVDDIASGAGTTRTTFYLHFASKAKLMAALIGEVTDAMEGSDDPPLADVIAAGERERIRDWHERRFDQWPEVMPYITAAQQAAAVDAEIAGIVAQWYEQTVIADIRAGLDRADRFPPESRHVRAVLAFGQVEFLSRRWQAEGWDVGRDVALETITDSWCSLLAGPK
jgi:AcrR family transcriptional regulator